MCILGVRYRHGFFDRRSLSKDGVAEYLTATEGLPLSRSERVRAARRASHCR